MSAKTIKSALGLLQDDPDNGKAWDALRTELSGDAGMSVAELSKLLDAARKAHEGRRELDAVAKLLELEVEIATDERKGELLASLARVLDDDLLDAAAAQSAYERLVALGPDTALGQQAAEALGAGEAKRGKWRELVDHYVS